MTAEQFTYWLQGFSELNAEPPTAEQWQGIKDHLATVFVKVTPPLRQAIGPQVLDPMISSFPVDIATRVYC